MSDDPRREIVVRELRGVTFRGQPVFSAKADLAAYKTADAVLAALDAWQAKVAESPSQGAGGSRLDGTENTIAAATSAYDDLYDPPPYTGYEDKRRSGIAVEEVHRKLFAQQVEAAAIGWVSWYPNVEEYGDPFDAVFFTREGAISSQSIDERVRLCAVVPVEETP